VSGAEKLMPLMIGKGKKVRCFKNIKVITQLPVTWKNNRKAWMNNATFEWLRDLKRSKLYCCMSKMLKVTHRSSSLTWFGIL